MSKREVRAFGRLERRAAGEAPKIGGYAAVFNSATNIAGMFMEQIAPGAFGAAIGRDDVRALFNHDPNYVLGRNTNSTLSLSEDATGLGFDCTPPDTAWARDLMVSIERGDVSQCSFSFDAQREEWDFSADMPMRTLIEVELYDVSVVTYPAYEDTSVGMRSLQDARAAREVVERQQQDNNTAAIERIAQRLRMRHALTSRAARA